MSAVLVEAPRRTAGARRRRPRLRGAMLLPLAAAAYCGVLALRLRDVVGAVWWNSDAAISPLVARSLGGDGNGRTVVMNADTFINAIWFDRLTAWMPGHRLLWMGGPLLLCAGAALLCGWTVRRLGGSAAAGVALAASAPPAVLLAQVPQEFHVSTFLNGVLLAALLVALATGRLSGRTRVAVLALCAGVTGLDLSSDPLLLVTGIVPMAGAAVAMRLGRPGRAARETLRATGLTLAGAALVSVAVGALTSAEGIDLLPVEGNAGHPASPGRMLDNARLALGGLVRIADGGLLGARLDPASPRLWLAGLLVAGGLLLPWLLLVREARRGRAAGDPVAPARLVHVAYWLLVEVLTLGAYAGTTLATDASTVRYLVPLFWGTASLLPLASTRAGESTPAGARPRPAGRALVLTAVGAGTLWIVLSALGVASTAPATYRDEASLHDPGAISPDLPALAVELQARGLHRGYADYWDSGSLTWATDWRLLVRPVMMGEPCGDPGGRALCAYHWNTADGWYEPAPGERSFLLLHAGASCLPGPPPIPAAGRFSVGSTEVLVFDHDIAGDLVRSRFALCPPLPR